MRAPGTRFSMVVHWTARSIASNQIPPSSSSLWRTGLGTATSPATESRHYPMVGWYLSSSTGVGTTHSVTVEPEAVPIPSVPGRVGGAEQDEKGQPSGRQRRTSGAAAEDATE